MTVEEVLAALQARTLDPEQAARLLEQIEGEEALRGTEPVATAQAGPTMEELLDAVRRSLAEALFLEADGIDIDQPLNELGMDSIVAVEWIRTLNGTYGTSIAVTSVYDHPSVRAFAKFLGGLIEAARPVASPPVAPVFSEQRVQPAVPVASAPVAQDLVVEEPAVQTLVVPEFVIPEGEDAAIAIVGASGQFPMANDLQQFWRNLAEGRNCVVEIPAERWAMGGVEDPQAWLPGKTDCKWMGVMDGVDLFDPLFFRIAPADAEVMDPQQRLFLQHCWSCIENAAIDASALSGLRCGVFAGCSTGDYSHLLDKTQMGAESMIGSAPSILSARISYLLNLNGPCLSIDTACSSSLVAIATACDSLVLKRSDLALAGGVSVLSGPGMHVMAGKAGMLSKQGACFTFDARADGFVPGEGVGVVLLKRLADAVRDGDPIHAVIRGWGVNQDGKTAGITAPSVRAQCLLEKEVYERFNIDPASISLVEAHGTGTKLGDPIEVEALTTAFRSFTKEQEFCALGSVKSNVGHLMAAAGVSGLIKAMLSISHRMLPPTIHFEQLNEHVRMDNSPFFINSTLKPWEEKDTPRRAAVSSFGFSGTNAHVVLEEYSRDEAPQPDRAKPVLVVVSARDQDRLKAQAAQLAVYLTEHPELRAADVAYTLQVGRQAMEARLAFVANSTAQMAEILGDFARGTRRSQVLVGSSFKERAGGNVLQDDDDAHEMLRTWLRKAKLRNIAKVWVEGVEVEWRLLHEVCEARRIALPTYPFARERYWVPEAQLRNAAASGERGGARPLHPLVQSNTSDFEEQRFSSVFSGEEFYLADHRVRGERVLPGVAYLEMACAAIRKASGPWEVSDGMRLRNVVWARPFGVKDVPGQLHIGLYPSDDGQIEYEVFSGDVEESDREVHSQGCIEWRATDSDTTPLSLQNLRSLCSQQFGASEFYEAHRQLGIDYGDAHRGVTRLGVGSDERGARCVLAELELPQVVSQTHGEFVLHPTLLDSALHASLAMKLADAGSGAGSGKPMLPFALEELTVYGRCPTHAFAWIREAAGSTDSVYKLDVDLCDEQGQVYVQVRGFSARVLEGKSEAAQAAAGEAHELMRFEEQWQEQPLGTAAVKGEGPLVCFVSGESAQSQVRDALRGLGLPDEAVFVAQAAEYERRDASHYWVRYEQTEDYAKALHTIVQERGTPRAVLYLWSVQGATPIAECSGLVRLVQALASEQVNCARVLVTGNGRDEAERAQVESWNGFTRSLRTILPHSWLSVVADVSGAPSIGEWTERVYRELGSERAQAVRYEGGSRHVSVMREVKEPAGRGGVTLRRGGTYLITGGAGGLGLVFARHLAREYAANLILTGRTELDDTRRTQLRELEVLGAKVRYVAADVCDESQMAAVISEGEQAFGALHGVIHSAGVGAKKSILQKSVEEFQGVLAPKVSGTLLLERVLGKRPLDFICYFSSSSAVLGDFGSCDYAIGNRYQQAYAGNSAQGSHRVAISWPLWREGGLQVGDAQQTEAYLSSSGQRLLESEEGLRLFEQLLLEGVKQQLVLAGYPSRVRRSVGIESAQKKPVRTTAADSGVLSERTLQFLKKRLSASLRLDADRIEAEAPFERYGIDSIMVMQLTNELEKSFGSLSKTLFFEYQNLNDLSAYFVRAHSDRLKQLLELQEQVAAEPDSAVGGEVTGQSVASVKSGRRRRRGTQPRKNAAERESLAVQEIAIIGVAGRYPQARSVWQFWENLKGGKDSVTEIPGDRWDYRAYFDPQKGTLGKTNSKWGGFVDGVAEFDPLFFNISPREAEMLDPQERLFLQCAYETLEDAGYTRETLSRYRSNGLEGNVGVFVGVMYQEYQLFGAQAQAIGRHVAVPGNTCSIANRVSYFFNFHGPSISLDTACSSSLTAIHLACQSLQRGGCEVAIAGGVNLSVHPNKYLALSQGQFCSSKGRCESFGEGGDGYVPGEGVGAVLLKPLWKAREDGDHIYAVIKASAINHGGKTNGYSVPNPTAQSQVVSQCLQSAAIPARAISYIEAHGTGTSLGDPIEVAGLSRAFEASTADKQFCALGSAKSNIGHCESAAGIAGITKVVLQMKHQQLVPSLHSQVLNPHIDFAATPFIVQQELAPWKRPVVQEQEYPRLAGVSSFGAGGANAHVILQEYVEERSEQLVKGPYLIVLSGNSESALQEQAKRLLEWVESQAVSEAQLGSLAYTLQVGREALEHRLAVRVRTLSQLKERLGRYIGGEQGIEELYRGEVKRNREALSAFTADEELQQALRVWLEKGKHGKLLELWVKGLAFEWSQLYAGAPPRRMSLPTYPFTRERFWIPEGLLDGRADAEKAAAVLHPLVQQNTSNFDEQRFSSVFSGEEFYLADHRVRGERVLPGVAYLEMARAALESEGSFAEAQSTGLRLRNVVWARPFTVGDHAKTLHISLYPQESGEVDYEIYSAADDVSRDVDVERSVHSQGCAIPLLSAEQSDELKLPLTLIKKSCDRHVTAQQCYDAYRNLGIEYGAAHQGVGHMNVGSDELGERFVLAELRLPQVVSQTHARFGLHPSLMDSALQCCIGWNLSIKASESAAAPRVMLPYALDELVFRRAVPSNAFAYITRTASADAESSLTKFDLKICDTDGRVCVEMTGFTCREFAAQDTSEHLGTLLLQPTWLSQEARVRRTTVGERCIVLCVPDEMVEGQAEELQGCLPDAQIIYRKEADAAGDFETVAKGLIEVLQGLHKRSRGEVLVQLAIAGWAKGSLHWESFWALAGVLKAAQLENPSLSYQVIGVAESLNAQRLQSLLEENRSASSQLIRYVRKQRQILQYEEIGNAAEPVPCVKPDGVYLITGGMGGLGKIFAEEILNCAPTATVVLAGRSELSTQQQQSLVRLGWRASYVQMDVGDADAVSRAVRDIRSRYGRLTGVIHSAGAARDNFLIRKTPEEIEDVLRAKVAGTINLDEATKEEPLDLFVLFSSVSAVAGNVGQSDYATANAFMDGYGRYRESLVAAGQRSGRSVSINWPLWLDGTMKVDRVNLERIRAQSGLTELPREAGIRAFHQALAQSSAQVVVAHGVIEKLRTSWLQWINAVVPEKEETPPAAVATPKTTIESAQPINDAALTYFKRVLAKSLKIPLDRVDGETQLEKYGVDSVLVMQMTNELEKGFGSLPKTLFFEYQTLQELSAYFVRSHEKRLVQLLGLDEAPAANTASVVSEPVVVQPKARTGRRGRARSRWRGSDAQASTVVEPANAAVQEIAIVGLAGRYPQARSVWQFWENLKAGVDSISEIPGERWDCHAYFDPQKGQFGKSYSKWGGFIEGAAEFDPFFFNISPREAEMMDPQERLFLQCVYETVEDAGYTRESLNRVRGAGLEGNVGVFVGVMYEEYQLYGAQAQALGQPLGLISNPASIANRVSYFFNWHGPSMSVDTMCSSSLTAIHLACQSLQRGGCEVAIAGGVNLSVHPNKYLALSQGQFCSSKGRCESFGEGGDGYVPGEGVGAVLLKPLWKAREDGDHIYAVIKASAINHGGKTNGYSVPNPTAQSQVVSQCLQSAAIPARAISYIEAHGTGTSLGDPIEVAGLSRAFEASTADKQFCALGSAKSNIGHCESAAGIAGITKVVLQMKHQQLVPSLHSQVLNPHIDFAATPFIVQQELAPWKRPVVQEQEYPRLAGVSSFGAGGANAHVILQEYVEERSEQLVKGPYLIVLSGNSESALQEQAKRLLEWVESQAVSEAQLGSLAYTLQVGREALEHRLAVRVRTLSQLKERLGRYIGGEQGIEELYRGEVKRNREALSAFTADEELQQALRVWLEKGKHGKLLELWVKGLAFEWSQLYAGAPPRRMSLPTYPFTRERFWISEGILKGVLGHSGAGSARGTAAVLHPLVQQNTSVLGEQRFSSVFSGEEFYLADHRVRGERVLPGVAYLEMARAAFEKADEVESSSSERIRLKNVVWAQPFSVKEEARHIHIGLYPLDGGDVDYEVYSTATGSATVGAQREVHSQGCVARIPFDSASAQRLSLEALLSGCDRHMSEQECYEACRYIGLDYGAAHQGVTRLGSGTDASGAPYVLAELQLPQVVSQTHEQFVLHPTLLDSALHASIGLATAEQTADTRLRLPYGLDELTIHGRCPTRVFAWIREAPGSTQKVHKLDIDLCDEQGQVYVQVRGFSARVLEGKSEAAQAAAGEAHELMRFEEQWQEQPLGTAVVKGEGPLVCFVSGESAQSQVRDALRGLGLPDEAIFVAQAAEYERRDASHYWVRYEHTEDYAKALHTIVQERGTPRAVLYLWSVQGATPIAECSGLVRLVQALASEQVNCARVLVTGNGRDEAERAQVESWNGFTRSLRTILPHSWLSVVADASGAPSIGEWTERVYRELGSERAQAVRYEGGSRHVSVMREVKEPAGRGGVTLRRGGTYLITGGAGGLGLVFARHLAREYAANLILTGRTELDDTRRTQLRELEVLGAKVRYVAADVCDESQMAAVISEGEQAFGALHGVIHSAGVGAKKSILQKSVEEFQGVLAPKVSGTLLLERVLGKRPLDFICYFSSSSAVLGDFGSCDYAIGNRYQQAYAGNAAQGSHRVAISWPLWREGGLQVGDAQQTEAYLSSSGQRLLESEEGLRLFEQLLLEGVKQQLVIAGNPNRVRRQLGIESTTKRTEVVVAGSAVETGADVMTQRTVQHLKKLLAGPLRIEADRIEADAPLERYGIDSVLVMQLTNELEKTFGSLSKTLFFEYQTLQELGTYFVREHQARLQSLLGLNEQKPKQVAEIPQPPAASRSRNRVRAKRETAKEVVDTAQTQDIAIVGLSGRYPQARDMSEFWENLKAGKDSITEIPADRWDYREYFDEQKGKPGKSYSKWGGFIDGVAEFDPLFFNISPREAEMLDPQERLFLQCVYETVEDAGYTRESLSRHRSQGLDGNIGVFVGVMYQEYQLFGAESRARGKPFGLINNSASIANRVSYFFNWHGPSMSVDTMCSSSLTAIHLACQSLQRGGCEVAIAGGVNVSVHPNKYLALSQGQFCSSEGRCESFGEGGDGYVPGEGVGSVMLKPLWRAQQDGDHIYGVIKASSINHGGKTNGYSVPNPHAQAQVVNHCLQTAGVPARAISYIEAHGTGTSLGDPIEMTGLRHAFEMQTSEKQFCALGSVKSNIGHCESAAAISGVTKVLLQMQHRQLVPSLHSSVLNPHIDFATTPFTVQQEVAPWNRPVVNEGGVTKEYPRLAGVSSFGAGGSNAHLILQEYVEDAAASGGDAGVAAGDVMVVLSGATVNTLREQAQRLLKWIETRGLGDADLRSLAYTLQVGRASLEHRLGLLASSMQQLKDRLERYVSGEPGIEDLYRGEVTRGKDTLSAFTADEDLQNAVRSWLDKGKYGRLLELWVKGLVFDWRVLYGEKPPRRISLPTYPFARERYWIASPTEQTKPASDDFVIRISGENAGSFDEKFYNQILDEILSGAASVDEAVAKTEALEV